MQSLNNKFIVGVDIGGTKINVVLFRGAKVMYKDKQPTETQNLQKLMDQLESMISSVISPLRRKEILGIGCGIAGALDLEKGQILKAPNLPVINGFKIREWLSKKFHREVFIDNDTRSFLRGEHLWGAGKGYKNLVGLTLGTGVGGGIIIDGKIINGANDAAGEIGHMIIKSEIRPPSAKLGRGRGNSKLETNDFEELAGARALKNFGFSDSLKAYNLARKGDKNAREAFEKVGEYLGISLANIVNILDPQAIIIGGGLTGAEKFILPQARKTMKKLITSPKAAEGVLILLSKLGEDAGAMGAAALLLES